MTAVAERPGPGGERLDQLREDNGIDGLDDDEQAARVLPLHHPAVPVRPPRAPPISDPCVKPGPDPQPIPATRPKCGARARMPGSGKSPVSRFVRAPVVLTGAVVREKLRATTATAVRIRAYDVVTHQQAAMPEQLLAPQPPDPETDDQEPARREGARLLIRPNRWTDAAIVPYHLRRGRAHWLQP
ncbi:hypothetical protein ACBR38_33535 [Streptomyces sp. MAD19A]|uniref:hypothetical protein n=1 Tax=Streptomyces sp. MAD19A TaxID=3242896 RepID=UPI003526CD63